MIMFILGFFSCFASFILLGKTYYKKKMKNCKYAYAVYDEGKERWLVHGQYLCIAGKIRNGLTANDGTVKYKK